VTGCRIDSSASIAVTDITTETHTSVRVRRSVLCPDLAGSVALSRVDALWGSNSFSTRLIPSRPFGSMPCGDLRAFQQDLSHPGPWQLEEKLVAEGFDDLQPGNGLYLCVHSG
jgi:hypothetical protein